MKLNLARATVVLVFAALSLSGCGNETVTPDPMALTRDSNGFYCNMIIVDHPGPKAQVFEKGYDKPFWFPSVRDALSYLMLPGEAQRVLAVYVHDMGRAGSWKNPQNDGIWIKAQDAFYVLDSKRRGGMGTRETVPFKQRTDAEKFIAEHGGRIASFKAIPSEYVLGGDGDDFGRQADPGTNAEK